MMHTGAPLTYQEASLIALQFNCTADASKVTALCNYSEKNHGWLVAAVDAKTGETRYLIARAAHNRVSA